MNKDESSPSTPKRLEHDTRVHSLIPSPVHLGRVDKRKQADAIEKAHDKAIRSLSKLPRWTAIRDRQERER